MPASLKQKNPLLGQGAGKNFMVRELDEFQGLFVKH